MVFYYAVPRGRQPGIYMSWPECNDQVKGFKGAVYKKFNTQQEAERFMSDTHSGSRTSSLGDDTQSDGDAFVPEFYVYTDGACVNNGRPDAAAGIGVFFGEGDARNVSRRLAAEDKHTNNVAELIAIRTAIEMIDLDCRVTIVSDSQYAIGCATSYGAKCSAENWIREIPNRDLVKQVYELFQSRRENLRLAYIAAHTGAEDVHSRGNACADTLANAAVGCEGCPYASGFNASGFNASSKIYLIVPFSQKDEAKSLGAKWDANKKKWYIFDDCPNKEQLLELFYTDV